MGWKLGQPGLACKLVIEANLSKKKKNSGSCVQTTGNNKVDKIKDNNKKKAAGRGNMKNRPVYRGIYNTTFPGFALLWVELFWALFTQPHHHKVYVHFQAKKERLYFASFCFLTFISTKKNCSKVSIRHVTFENWKAQLVKELLSLDFWNSRHFVTTFRNKSILNFEILYPL